VVGWAVIANNPTPVNGERDRQVWQADIMNDLIQRALKKGRVDRNNRQDALKGKAGGKGDRVLLGNPDIKKTIGKFVGKIAQTGTGWHGCRNSGNPAIRPGQFEHGVAKNPGVTDGFSRGLGGTGFEIKRSDPMIVARFFFRRLISLAFGGQNMDQYRAIQVVADILHGGNQVFEFMAGDGAYIVEFQRFKEHTRSEKTLDILFTLLEDAENIVSDSRHVTQLGSNMIAELTNGLAGHLTIEKAGEGPDVW